MVNFRHLNVVGGEVVHDFRQILVHGEEDIYADAEVGGVEEGFALFLAFLLDLADTVQPSGSTRYDRHAYLETFHIVIESGSRGSKLNRRVGALERFRIYILSVIDIYDGNNLMSSLDGDLLDRFAHFPVTYKCNFHTLIQLMSQIYRK